MMTGSNVKVYFRHPIPKSYKEPETTIRILLQAIELWRKGYMSHKV